MAYNKVTYGGNTLIDLTEDTVTPDKLAEGITAHDRGGNVIVGTNTYDVDTKDATATKADILEGKTAYADGQKISGTMRNVGTHNTYFTTKDQTATIWQGYHSGDGKVQISEVEKEKIIAGNIKQGVVILGVTGSLRPAADVKAQAKTITPASSSQTIIPDTDYDYLSQVVVNPIPYTESFNSAGGITITIG